MTFHEVTCRSALNKVPEASRMPFRWTINPYRGCSMPVSTASRARRTSTSTSTPARLRLADRGQDQRRRGAAPRAGVAPSWHGRARRDGHQRRLLPAGRGPLPADARIIPALRDAANPFSILTKGALILRDLDLLVAGGGGHRRVGGAVDRLLDTRHLAQRRARARRRRPAGWRWSAGSTTPGIPTGVLMAPVLPYLTDSDEQLEETVAAIAASGATYVSPIVLHLRPGRPRVVAGLARAASDPTCSPATPSSTAAAPTRPRPTRTGSPPPSAGWPRCTASAASGWAGGAPATSIQPYAGRSAAGAGTRAAGPALTGSRP